MFEAYTDDGRLQVDASEINYYLVASGQVNTSLNWPPGHFGAAAKYQVLPGTIDAGDIIALRCTTQAVSIGKVDASTRAIVTEAAAAVTWYAFRRFDTQSPSSAGGGLETYKNGKVAFSTIIGAGKVLRLYSVTPIVAMSAGMNTLVGLPTGRTFAFIISPSFRQVATVNGSPPTFNVDTNKWVPDPNGAASGIKSESNGFRIREIPGFTYLMGNNYNGRVMAIDVTGF